MNMNHPVFERCEGKQEKLLLAFERQKCKRTSVRTLRRKLDRNLIQLRLELIKLIYTYLQFSEQARYILGFLQAPTLVFHNFQ